MSDVSTADDVGIEAEADPVETEQVEAAVEAVEEAEVTEEETEDEEAVEVIEFDFGGSKLQVPTGSTVDEVAEKLQEFGTNLHGDYTKKTQAVAEQLKQVETDAERVKADRAAVDKLVNLQGEAFGTFSQGLQLKAEIEQLSAVDLNALWQSDPDQARRVSDTISAKQAELQSVASKVAAKTQEFEQAQAQETTQRLEDGKRVIAEKVKDFDAAKVVDYVVANGIPKADAEKWALSPAVTIMAHKAMKFDAMQTRAKPPGKVVKPVKPVKGSGGTSIPTDPNKMTMDQFVKWREANP